jgi:hypothetical protein
MIDTNFVDATFTIADYFDLGTPGCASCDGFIEVKVIGYSECGINKIGVDHSPGCRVGYLDRFISGILTNHVCNQNQGKN